MARILTCKEYLLRVWTSQWIETDTLERHTLQSSPAAGLGVTLGTSSRAFKSPPSSSRRQTERGVSQDSGLTDLGLRPVAPVATDLPSVASKQAATAAATAAQAVIATAMRGLQLGRQTTSEDGQPTPRRWLKPARGGSCALGKQDYFPFQPVKFHD